MITMFNSFVYPAFFVLLVCGMCGVDLQIACLCAFGVGLACMMAWSLSDPFDDKQ